MRESTKESSAAVADIELPKPRGRTKHTTKKGENYMEQLDSLFDISQGDKEQVKLTRLGKLLKIIIDF